MTLSVLTIFGCSKKPDTPQEKENKQLVNTATKICNVLESTGLAHECDISIFTNTISFRVDANAVESKAICNQVANMEGNYIFRREWTIEVFSPFSGEHAVASCVL